MRYAARHPAYFIPHYAWSIMPQPDLIIFDCDGTLVDSEIIAARVDAELLTEAGFEISAEEYAERYAGLTFRDSLLRIEAEAQVPFQASLIERSAAILDQRLANEVRAVDGAQAAVAATTAPKCICSNSSPDRLDAMLRRSGLLPFFTDRVYSARAIPTRRPKPAPDVFNHALETLGADARRSFAIEDSVHGIHAAKAAGLRVIGFTGASHSWPGHADELTEAGAETVIRRWAELHPTIAALSEWSE
jgi:HAD superfamily hydrolase (TIGR01509 family)